MCLPTAENNYMSFWDLGLDTFWKRIQSVLLMFYWILSEMDPVLFSQCFTCSHGLGFRYFVDGWWVHKK